MKPVVFILFLLSFVCLSAQVDPYSSAIGNLRVQVAQNPVDTASRLNLAYYLMLDGDSEDALAQYRLVLAQDSLSLPAAMGILWSLNNSRDWHTSLTESARLIKLFPEAVPLRNYRALAQSKLVLPYHARYTYRQASRIPADSLSLAYSQQGLAWSYLALRDYPLARRALKQAQGYGYQDSLAAKASIKPLFRYGLGCSWNWDSTFSVDALAGLSWRRYSTSLRVEQIYVDSLAYRTSYQLNAAYNAGWLELGLAAGTLAGEEERVYPADSYGCRLTTRFYTGILQIKPAILVNVGLHPSFNTYQASSGLQMSSDNILLGGYISYLYRDNESPGSDRKKYHKYLYTQFQALDWLNLGAYLYLGEQSWWMSPYGLMNDSFDSVDTALAFSAQMPLLRHLDLILFYQKGWLDEDSKDLISVSFTGAL